MDGSWQHFILYTSALYSMSHSPFHTSSCFLSSPPGKKNLTSIMQVAQWLVLSPWRKKVPSLNPLVIFAWSLYSDYSGFLLQSIDIHVRLTGVLKLVVGVNVSINDCVGLSVRLATFTGCTPFSCSLRAGIGCSNPVTLNWKKNGWMYLSCCVFSHYIASHSHCQLHMQKN